MHFLTLAINWYPEIRGITTVLIGVVALMGSVYLLLGTNLGARLGFLVAFAGLTGWLFLMGCVWWANGIGLKGPAPAWVGKEIIESSLSSSSNNYSQSLDGWRALSPEDGERGQAQTSADDVLVNKSSRFKAGDYVVTNVYDKGGAKHPYFSISFWKFGTWKVDMIAFWHDPHYVLVEVQPVIPQATDPGKAPPLPKADTAKPKTYVLLQRERGQLRYPAARIAIGSGLLFGAACLMLHRRDRRSVAHVTGKLVENASHVMGQYLPVLAMIILGGLFAGVSLVVSALLNPRKPNAAKNAPYECGIVPTRDNPERFPVSFYLVAMLFIMFDIEIIFLYPYAISLGDLGSYGFWAIVVFSAIFFLSFVYEVAKGGLDWGPLQAARRLEAAVSATRTTSTTIRRVGLEGRTPVDEDAA